MITCVRASGVFADGRMIRIEGHRSLESDQFDILQRRVAESCGGSADSGGMFEPWFARVDCAYAEYADLFLAHLCLLDDLDDSWALDFHTQVEEEDEGKSFRRTEMGDVIYQAKYQVSNSHRTVLTQVLCRFIQAHPSYARAEYIVPAPSTRRLPRLIAEDLANEMSLVQCTLDRNRPVYLQKEVDTSQKVENQQQSMLCQFTFPSNSSVIVVDDLYGIGATMAEAARALRDAGASRVLGLVGTKTMTATRGGGAW